jgi:hypothetical protein
MHRRGGKPGRLSVPRRPAWHPAVGLGEEDGWMAPEEQSSGMDRMGRYLSVRRARLCRSSPRAFRTYPFRPAVGGGLGRPNTVFGVAADAGCAWENVRSGGRWGVLGAAWLRCGACGGRRSPCRCPEDPGSDTACRRPSYTGRLGMQHGRSFRQIGSVFTNRQPPASTDAGRTDSQGTVQRTGRLRLIDGGRGMGGAFAAQAFGERRARRVRRGLARFGLGRTGGDALREASSSTATRKRMIARCVRCRIATCPDQQRFPAPKTRKSG